MKKIVLKSKLSEDEVLKKLKSVSEKLLKDGLISSGDELVIEVDDGENGTMVTINGDIMSKDNYLKIKKPLLEIGSVITNDLKNFDGTYSSRHGDELYAFVKTKGKWEYLGNAFDLDVKSNWKNEHPDEEDAEFEFFKDRDSATKFAELNNIKHFDEVEKESEVSEGQNKVEHEESIVDNSIKPAVQTYHDSSELIFNINNKNVGKMENLKEQLFSDEEIANAPKSQDKVASEQKPAEEKKYPEVKEHDDKPKGEKKSEDQPTDKGEKKPEEKEHDDAPENKDEKKPEEEKEDHKDKKPEEKKEITFDSLLFSEDELKDDDEKKDPEEKNDSEGLVDMLKEVKEKVTKIFDQMPSRTPEEKVDMNRECPIAKKDAKKALAEYLQKAAQGKTLSVAEKYFCDTMTKYFTDEEVNKMKEIKADEKKPEVKEHDEKPEEEINEDHKPGEEVKETKEEMIRRLNKINHSNSLEGRAKESAGKIK